MKMQIWIRTFLRNGWRGQLARPGRQLADRNGRGRRNDFSAKIAHRHRTRSVRQVAGRHRLVACATHNAFFRKAFALSAFAVALAANAGAAFAQVADAKLETFFKKYLDEHLRQRPLEATRLGDHRFDPFLDDLSKKARDGWLALARQTLRELPRQIEYSKLSRDGQIDFEIFQHELATTIWQAENTRPFADDPRVYNDYLNDSVYTLLVQSTRPKETNVAHCLARMAQMPNIVTVAKETLRNPPRQLVETAIRQNRGAIAFYETGIFNIVGETRQLEALKFAAARVAALLKDYQKFLENDLLPRAKGDWRLGKRKFARKLEMVLDAGVTADQVFAEAEAEFARVQRDLY